MKKLTIWTQKGGVGKTALVCQLAHVLRGLGLRVLVIDLDSQGNASLALLRAEKAVALDLTAAALLMNANPPIGAADAPFAVIRAVPELCRIPEQPCGLNRFHENFRLNLERLSTLFDICLIDCPPSDDLRILLALSISDYVLSPIQLNQEAIEGIVKTVRGSRGVVRVREKFNPGLRFLGILPNMVEPTPLQRRNFVEVLDNFGKYLLLDERGDVLRILRRSAIAEAQECGVPLSDLAKKKTAARDAWTELRPVLDRIAGLVTTVEPTMEAADAA